MANKGNPVATGVGGVSPHQNMFGYHRALDYLSYKDTLGCLRIALYTKNLSCRPFYLFNYILVF